MQFQETTKPIFRFNPALRVYFAGAGKLGGLRRTRGWSFQPRAFPTGTNHGRGQGGPSRSKLCECGGLKEAEDYSENA